MVPAQLGQNLRFRQRFQAGDDALDAAILQGRAQRGPPDAGIDPEAEAVAAKRLVGGGCGSGAGNGIEIREVKEGHIQLLAEGLGNVQRMARPGQLADHGTIFLPAAADATDDEAGLQIKDRDDTHDSHLSSPLPKVVK